jgi:alpha-methylacyl-CoA racemase
MVDGAALLMSLVHSMSAIGWWREEAGVNILDSGLPFYDAYLTADGKWLAIGCLEPQFYAEWLRIAGLDGEDLPAQLDPSGWRVLRQRFAEVVATRTRDEWAALADGTDACIAPVLTMSEAPHHPHLAARRTFVEVDGMMQAAPAPRFSGTPAGDPRPVVASDRSALLSWGVDAARIATLADAGVLPD